MFGGGLLLSGRPSSPFQPMAAGLEGRLHAPGALSQIAFSKPAIVAGCKWREDGDVLELDLSQDLPGKLNTFA